MTSSCFVCSWPLFVLGRAPSQERSENTRETWPSPPWSRHCRFDIRRKDVHAQRLAELRDEGNGERRTGKDEQGADARDLEVVAQHGVRPFHLLPGCRASKVAL